MTLRALPFALLFAAVLPAQAVSGVAATATLAASAEASTGGSVAAAAIPACTVAAVSPAVVLAQVTEVLQAAVPRPFERVELEMLGALPAGLSAPEVSIKSAWPAARVAVELRWDVCGEAARKLVWFKARAWRQAWVYGRAAGRDAALAEAQPSPALVDMAQWRLPDSDLAAAPAGEYLARPVQSGAPLRRADLKPAPLVKRNDRITVLVQGRGLQLRVAALALQFGAAEEWIAVMVDGAEKSIRARVVAPGVVHVDI